MFVEDFDAGGPAELPDSESSLGLDCSAEARSEPWPFPATAAKSACAAAMFGDTGCAVNVVPLPEPELALSTM